MFMKYSDIGRSIEGTTESYAHFPKSSDGDILEMGIGKNESVRIDPRMLPIPSLNDVCP
jgi:hypothetical protein